MNSRISIADNEQQILDCYSVMAELRPHIQPDQFLPKVRRLTEIAGFQLAYLEEGEIKAVAGFRVSEWLAGGRYLEIEDLVAKSGERSKGYGGKLSDWLVHYAKKMAAGRCGLFRASVGSMRTVFTFTRE